ncbi:MAG TPA: hypothetical protein VHM20_05175, partial [Gammaproteobacteria bacterium]|nr:hypothetical protein [Gammaproteobacteria bacterium]
MSADRGIESLLEEYKKSFLELKDSKASFLKTKFPRAELWRFFIEIPRQNEGLGWLENVMRILDTNERKELPALLDKPVEFHLKNVEELPRENQSLKGLLAGIATSAMDNLLVSDDEKRKEKFEKFSLGDMLTFYAGWLPFEETEPGCVKAFIDELLELEEKSKDSKLEEGREAFVKRNTALIKTFHKNVSKNVKNLLPEVKGEFRSKETARFSVNIGINFSEQGANEVLLSMARLSEKFPEFKADYDTSDDNDYYVSAITPSEKQSVS